MLICAVWPIAYHIIIPPTINSPVSAIPLYYFYSPVSAETIKIHENRSNWTIEIIHENRSNLDYLNNT